MMNVFRAAHFFKFLNGLRRMLLSVKGSALHLIWAFGLVLLINFVFGLFICEQISDSIHDAHKHKRHLSMSTTDFTTNVEPERRMLHVLSKTDPMTTYQAVNSRFGTIHRCMLTLFLSISGGDWGELAQPLGDLRVFLIYVYAAYVLMMVFGILNVLTGTFVESAIEATSLDRDNAIEATIQEKDSFVNRLRKIFEETDTDHSGQVSFEEFETHLRNEEVAAYLQSMGLHTTEARGLFQLLDADSSGSVGIEELVSGCMRLKGHARSVDVATLIYENKRMMKIHTVFSQYCKDQFCWLEGSIQALADSMRVLDQHIQMSSEV